VTVPPDPAFQAALIAQGVEEPLHEQMVQLAHEIEDDDVAERLIHLATRVRSLERGMDAEALRTAETWAEGGYTAESRAYWRGMRDTLRVLRGVTKRSPRNSGDDAAATTLLRGIAP
jgi:hypothetical protein